MKVLGFIAKLVGIMLLVVGATIFLDAKFCPGAGNDILICLVAACLIVIAWEVR